MMRVAGLFLGLLLVACSTTPEPAESVNATACQVIYDAGSSGTQLYIYQQTASGWVRHKGPKMPALADPARSNREKTMADAEAVTDTIVVAMTDIRRDGPARKDGSPRWRAFDWRTECHLENVAVYATAGMRLAERDNPADSALLWALLNQKLSAVLEMKVTTRTLTGFEEGVFAWLATREEQADGYFGIAEMGGVSAQISFPCTECDTSRLVGVQGVDIPMISLSFLGLGQDEAWKDQANHSECLRGVGLKKADWLVADCSDDIEIPENIGQMVRQNVKQATVRRWYLTGAFGYSEYTDIDNYCRHNIDSGYQAETSCFRAVYQPYFLNSLGVPLSSESGDVDWTLGAVICKVSDCLAKAGPPECQWSSHGCAK